MTAVEESSWTAVRRRYPGVLGGTYLDTAHRGIPAPETVEAVERFIAIVRECPGSSATEDTVRLITMAQEARGEVAALIGATEREAAVVESTQHGLSIAADLLGLGPGDRVVTDDLEFVGVVLPWRSQGVDLTVVPNRSGAVSVADLEAAIDARTRAVVVSAVQEVNGYRIDLDALSSVCRDRAIPLVVDGIQHVGPLRFDVRSTPVDFLAVGAHKWLGSPFGAGFLYVRDALVSELEPRSRGHVSIADPPEGWERYIADPARSPTEELRFVDAARKFEIAGTPNFAGSLALAAAVRVLRDLGPDRVEQRVLLLAARLADGLQRLGATLATPPDETARSGIVCFRVPGGSVEDDRALLAHLTGSGISVSLRFNSGVGGIRSAPYFYNDPDDIDRLLEAVGAYAARAAQR